MTFVDRYAFDPQERDRPWTLDELAEEDAWLESEREQDEMVVEHDGRFL